MSISSLVDKIHYEFNNNNHEFVVDSIFGKLYVVQATEGYDLYSPVTVLYWEEGRNRVESKLTYEDDIDYYVSIGNAFLRVFPAKMHIIEAVVRVMFFALLGHMPPHRYVDVMVHYYLHTAEGEYVPTYDKIYDEFLYVNFDVLSNKVQGVRNLAAVYIRDRIAICNMICKDIQMLIHDAGYDLVSYRFNSEFWMYTVAMVAYLLKRYENLRVVMSKEKFTEIAVR